MIRYKRSRGPEERLGRGFVTVGLLTMAMGLTFSSAAATGEHTTAVLTSPLSSSSSTFTWSYEFHGNGGHELSNIAVSFCSTDILSHVVSASPSGQVFLVGDVPGGHPGFGQGIKFETAATTGTLTIVFDKAFTADGTMLIQSHSGDGNQGDQSTGTTGPGPCPQSTTTTIRATTTTTVPGNTTTTVPVVTTTTVPVVVTTATTVPGNTTTTVPAVTTTTVPGATTTSTAPATTTTTGVPTAVLGEVFFNDPPSVGGGGMAHTGFTGAPLIAAGLLFVALGAALMVGGTLKRART